MGFEEIRSELLIPVNVLFYIYHVVVIVMLGMIDLSMIYLGRINMLGKLSRL